LVIKAGESFIHTTSLYLFGAKRLFFSHFSPCRNIVTYRAEDGSGVGSAIIAGACGVITWAACPSVPDPIFFSSYDEEQER
jgi:hypothetical protein